LTALLLIAAPCVAAAQQAGDTRTPSAIAVQTALERVCLPVLQGKAVDTVAKSAGVTDKDGRLWLDAGGKAGVAVIPPTPVNPTVCRLHVTFPAAQDGTVEQLLARWSAAKGLTALKTGERTQGSTMSRLTWSWEGPAAGGRLALVYAKELTLDGKPTQGAYEEGAILVSRSKA
jgi:hypothetical protein